MMGVCIVLAILGITGLFLNSNSNSTSKPKMQALKANDQKFSEYKQSPQASHAIKIGVIPKSVNTDLKTTGYHPDALHLLKLNKIPENFDWRNLQKHTYYPHLMPGNYCVPVRNQHIPVYCGSCFVFASVQALSDRFVIMKALQNKGNNQFTKVEFSCQHILNCLPDMTCQTGGDSYIVYKLIMNSGIPDETCKSYESNADPDKCDPPCYTCLAKGDNECSAIGETTFTKFGDNRCCKVDKYENYKIEGFSNINARFNYEVSNNKNGWTSKDLTKYIQTEIYLNGPVTVALDAIPIDKFKGGSIFVKKTDSSCVLNHLV
jgi:hypothetical protein